MSRALVASLLLAACSREPRVGAGSIVTLDYELSSGGAVVETSAGRDPMEVALGASGLPADVEKALLGAGIGDARTVELPPERGFGAPDPSKIRAVPLVKFGAMAKALKPGAVVSGASGGKAAEGRVLKIEKGSVTLDFNHPLAGKTLRYKLKVLSIR